MSYKTRQLIEFYKNQLRYFNQIGMGNQTKSKVIVSNQLIEATKRRLQELSFGIKIPIDNKRGI